jgi:hypothetical protein
LILISTKLRCPGRNPNILDVRDYKDHEFGPALLFAYEPKACGWTYTFDEVRAWQPPQSSRGRVRKAK